MPTHPDRLIAATLHHQWAVLRRNPIAFAIVLANAAVSLWVAAGYDRLGKAIAYIGAVAVGFFLVDLFTRWKPNAPAMPVRRPGLESMWVVGCCVVGYLVMFSRFVWLDWEALPGLARLAFIPLFGFVFPVVTAIALFAFGYRPRDLGFRWSASCWVFLPVLALVACTALLVAPQEMTWRLILEEMGIMEALFTGLISAALSEEFLRLTLQTRLGALWNNGIAWYIAALLWAFLHIPKVIGEGSDPSIAVLGCLYIVPLGLLWGYLTHRTRSIWPALLCHGLNVWGLQNF